MNDTKSQTNRQNQRNQRQKTRQEQGGKGRGPNSHMLHDARKDHEQEHAESRLTR